MELVVDAEEEAGEDEEAVSRAARALVTSRRTGVCLILPPTIEHKSGTIVLVPVNIFFRVESKVRSVWSCDIRFFWSGVTMKRASNDAGT